ncbi:OmpA family protein [Maribacter sp. 2210JD10-5]|uniref:OmpA family protein n=1 Tax=Maribacter sp. 2210JD10-5 TaxID=3386272 RepID=UPI0039BD30F6
MTRTTTNLLLMLITIVAGTFFYITLCSECGGGTTVEPEPPKEVVAPEIPEATSYPFALNDGEYSYNANDNYNFNISSSTILMPLSENVQNGIGGLKSFLDANLGKVLNITGFYKSDETNSSAFPNLGLARANAVKNHLASNGIAAAQMNTMGKLMDDMVPKDDIYLGPVSYSLDDKAENADEELNALYEKIKADPLVLYFNSAQASINLDAEQRQKVADISRYLDKRADASVNVIGHTDNTGKASTNMRLGLDRANFAKAYLMKNGISEAKINASTKGQTQPIESNATKEGQAKNRRTVVTLN